MTDIINEFFKNSYLLGLVFMLLLMSSEFIRYRKRMYYNDYIKYPAMKNHVLNTNFGLYKRPNLDYALINKYLFASSATAILIGGISMMINIWFGIILYVVSSSVLVYFVNKKVLTLFPETK